MKNPTCPYVSTEVLEKVNYLLAGEILNLYYPDVHVLPITVEGEVYREYLYSDNYIFRYGCYEYTLNFKGEIYTIILVNND